MMARTSEAGEDVSSVRPEIIYKILVLEQVKLKH